MKIAIVADTTCDLPRKLLDQYNIKMMPLRVIFKDGEFRDRSEITPKELYDRIETEIPTTSLPSIVDINNLFSELKADGYTNVIVVTLSSKVSGTYNLAALAAHEFEGLDIEVIDSKAVSIFYGLMVLEGARNLGLEDVDLIIEKMKKVRDGVKGCHLLDTLKYLKKGGRIGKVQGTVAEMLNIKPIIGIDSEGVYKTVGKVRGRKKAIREMISMARSQFLDKKFKLAIVHGNVEKDAEFMVNKIKEIGQVDEVIVTELCAVSGVHTGPGIVGYVAYEVE